MSHYNTDDDDDDDDNDNIDDDDGLNVNRDRGRSCRSQIATFHFQRFGASGCTQGGGS